MISVHDEENFLIKKLSDTGLPEPDHLIHRKAAFDFIINLYNSAAEYMEENNLSILSGGSMDKMKLMGKGIAAMISGETDLLESVESSILTCLEEESIHKCFEEFIEKHRDRIDAYNREWLPDIFREVYDIIVLSDDEQMGSDLIASELMKRMKKSRVVSINIEPLLMEMIEFIMDRKGFVRADVDYYREDIKKIIWTGLGREINADTVSLDEYADEIASQFYKEEFSIGELTDNLSEKELFRNIPYDRLLSTMDNVFNFLVKQGLIGSR
jgi:CYTH domain-containing protein